MDTSSGTRAARLALAALAAASVTWCGCRTDPSNPFFEDARRTRAGSALGADAAAATQPLDAPLLADAGWYDQAPESPAKRAPEDRRWHHRRLDPYLHPAAPRCDLAESLSGSDATSAANAAIVMAHWGAGEPTDKLLAAICAEKLPMPLRCAAVEALGFVERPSPAPALRRLLGEFTVSRLEVGDEKPLVRDLPDLHADLIRALARHAEKGDARWFIAAAEHPAWQVRLEGAAAWTALAGQPLPDQIVVLRADPDPRVRAAALATIAAHDDPRRLGFLQAALEDPDAGVRAAAFAGLREAGTAEARALLGRVQDRKAELHEAAALASRAARGLSSDLQASAAEAQAELRLAVNEQLDAAQQQGRQLVEDARQQARGYVEQASAQVGQASAAADAVSQAARQRAAEVRQLAARIRQANLPEQARREASQALAQMAADAQLEVRVQAARAMGELADPMFLPALVALLGDEPDVRTAAMASLAQVAGGDMTVSAGGRPLSDDERAQLWQLWYARQQAANGGR